MSDALPRYTLSPDSEKGDWVLMREGASRATRRFATKAEATKGGVLEDVIDKEGGSVRIQRMDGTYEEERTFPRSRDPKNIPG